MLLQTTWHKSYHRKGRLRSAALYRELSMFNSVHKFTVKVQNLLYNPEKLIVLRMLLLCISTTYVNAKQSQTVTKHGTVCIHHYPTAQLVTAAQFI
jgi:hypothetical protein